jgi:protein required for attachment to host cells
MTGSKTPAVAPGDWLVVLNGRRVRVLENVGTAERPHLAARLARSRPAVRDRDRARDLPYPLCRALRSHQRAVEGTSLDDVMEAVFVAESCRDLVALADGALPDLHLVAPARAMAAFRRHAQGVLRDRVVTEIVADLAKESVDRLEARFAFPGTDVVPPETS